MSTHVPVIIFEEQGYRGRFCHMFLSVINDCSWWVMTHEIHHSLFPPGKKKVIYLSKILCDSDNDQPFIGVVFTGNWHIQDVGFTRFLMGSWFQLKKWSGAFFFLSVQIIERWAHVFTYFNIFYFLVWTWWIGGTILTFSMVISF